MTDARIRYFNKIGVEVVVVGAHDDRSGWTGANYYLKTEKGYLNENGTYTDKVCWGTIDLSGNGFCYDNANFRKAKKLIKEHFANDITIV